MSITPVCAGAHFSATHYNEHFWLTAERDDGKQGLWRSNTVDPQSSQRREQMSSELGSEIPPYHPDPSAV
jgi:hypothetical protein